MQHYSVLELFAGAGGLALGFEKAGFKSCLLNEFNKDACATLRKNRPDWNVVEGDVSTIDFTPYHNLVDVLAGGFPCQAFSMAGKRLGFDDIRGTMFYEFARAIKEVNPKFIVAENVIGLLSHDGGKTLETITNVIDDLGYELVKPTVLKAVQHGVPQKRERLVLVGIRKDLIEKTSFTYPKPLDEMFTLHDALKAGKLYDTDVTQSEGPVYSQRKSEIMDMVEPGKNWKSLPEDIQVEYMKNSLYGGGGRTGYARRLAWDEPSLTLTCSPAQTQTERCHPDETRPLTVREYARIQTFPDEWEFEGSRSSAYKQIGNAVPVNLGYAIGCSLQDALKTLTKTVLNLSNAEMVDAI